MPYFKTNRVVLLTGCSRGIGRAAAVEFARRGWQVVASMRNPEPAQGWAEDNCIELLPMDVTKDDSIKTAISQIQTQYGRLDALINNAGYALMGCLEGMTDAEIRQQFDTNVLGLIGVTRASLPALRESKGVIVNVSSIGGRMAFPLTSAYHATKFAVEDLSESLRFELHPHGVRVKVIEPGGIRTGFIHQGTKWATHEAYTDAVQGWQRFTDSLDSKLPGPEAVAKTIVKAATSTSGRLRYSVKAGPYMMLNAILPDFVWRRVIGGVLRSHAAVA